MIFTDKKIDFTKEPLFFGKGRNVARLDLPIEEYITKLTDKQLSQFWMPHDVGMGQDAKDYSVMSNDRKEFFLKNIKFQTVLDSNASRGVFETLAPVTTSPHLEKWWTAHGFFEGAIHSPSYSEIIKALGIDASEVFDDIMENQHILSRGEEISQVFNVMHSVAGDYMTGSTNHGSPSNYQKETLVRTLYALNILENIMFKTSFMCSFAFAENNMMEGSSKIISLIAADELLHNTMVVYLLKRLRKEPEYEDVFNSVQDDIVEQYHRIYSADLEWVDYLYESDPALIGLSANSLKAYSLYNLEDTMVKVGLLSGSSLSNPLPWSQKYLSRNGVQTAQMESDSISYLSGIVNKSDMRW